MSFRERGGAEGPHDGQADTEGPTSAKARPRPPPPPRRPDVQDDRANDEVTESPYSASGQTAAARDEYSWYSSGRDTRDWSRPTRARGGAMDVGRGAAGYDPSKHYPRYANDVLDGYWVHRDSLSWMSPRDNQSFVWHVAHTNDYNFYFPKTGKDSKDK
eukprot:5322231-Pyramimonas_sp.AAC.1